MSFIQRWPAVRTVRPQILTDHNYYVVVYTLQLCELLSIKQGDALAAVLLAVAHDTPELETGDMRGPFKRWFIEQSEYIKIALEDGELKVADKVSMGRHIRTIGLWPEIAAIVKVADTMDAVMYLCGEIQMGNTSFGNIIGFNQHTVFIETQMEPDHSIMERNLARLYRNWRKLPAERERLEKWWVSEVWPAITAQRHGQTPQVF